MRLAEAINIYLENKDIAAQYGQAAYGLRKEIDCNKVAKEWLKLMEKIVRGEN